MWFKIGEKFHYRIDVEPISSHPNTYDTSKEVRTTWNFACGTLPLIGFPSGSFNRIDTRIKQAHRKKVTRDEVETAFLLGADIVCKKCWNYDVQEQGRARAEEANRAALVAANEAKGEPEVKPYCIITLLELKASEENEPEKFYLAEGRSAVEPSHPMPKLPSDVQKLYTGEGLGKIILGKFVGEKVGIDAPAGMITYRIVDVKPFIGLSQEPEMSTVKEVEDERKRIYEGIGRNGGTRTESADASKYLGHMRHDGGQIGSYPAHDDYGDESDAEGTDEANYIDFSKD